MAQFLNVVRNQVVRNANNDEQKDKVGIVNEARVLTEQVPSMQLLTTRECTTTLKGYRLVRENVTRRQDVILRGI